MQRSTRLRRISQFAVLAVLPALLGACSVVGIDGYDDDRDRLETARAVWRSQGIDSYSFVLQRLCFCAGGTEPATVLVRGGERISVTVVETGQPVPADFTQYYLTVDELFDFIADAIDRKAHSIRVSYHATLGHPTSIAIDYLENAIDEEMAFEASALQPMR